MRTRADRRHELGPIATRVAALVALGAATVALLYVVFGSGATYEVNAVFEDVRGLIPGGEVKAGADRIGTVEDITLNERGLPVVRMSVDDDFRLREGAFADIRLSSNVGGVNRYVDLEQGKGPPLGDGATLGPSRTDQPVDLDLAFSELTPPVRNELAGILAAVDAAVRGHGADLDLAFRHSAIALGETADLLAQVNLDRVALRALVAQGRQVVGALAQGPADLGETAHRLALTLQVAAGRHAELARTARALGPGLRAGRQVLDELAAAVPNLRTLVAAARPAVSELVPTAREIEPAIAALRPLLDEASRLVEAAPEQVRILAPVIDAALPLVRRLGPLTEGLGPMLDYLRAWGPEVVSFFTLTADATASFDANGNLIRATAIPIETARHTNSIGPANTGPGLVERPFYRTPGSLEGEAWRDYWRSFVGGGERVESYRKFWEVAP
jgi:phospholipid/cholesterol/gamma-HCH transport system substrate-binding protein